MELTIDQALQKAISAHKAGQVQEADRYYTAILKLNPTHSDANHNMGVLAVGLGKLREAIPFFQNAVKAKPSIAQYWLSYINVLIKLDRRADAMEVLEQAKSEGVEGNKFDLLETQLRSSASETLNAQNPSQDQLQEVIDDYNSQNFNSGIEKTEALIKLFPKSSILFNIKGAILRGLNVPELAIDAYKEAVSLNPSFVQAYNNLGNVYRDQGNLKIAKQYYMQAIEINNNYAEVYNNLGGVHSDMGNLNDAISSYLKAIAVKPGYAEAWNNLGSTYYKLGEFTKAIEAFDQVLSLQPDSGSAKHMLASLSGITTSTAPREYIEKLFDKYASEFDDSLVKKLEYNIPRQAVDLMSQINGYSSFGAVLDLGCGTGLLGVELKNDCTSIIGVDLSGNMLARAESKNVYTSLLKEDIHVYLESAPLNFDFIVATDVFIYVGDLSSLFGVISSRARKGLKIIFSTEHHNEAGYHLRETGRYAHSKCYIETLCNKFNFKILSFVRVSLRKEKGNIISGALYALELE